CSRCPSYPNTPASQGAAHASIRSRPIGFPILQQVPIHPFDDPEHVRDLLNALLHGTVALIDRAQKALKALPIALSAGPVFGMIEKADVGTDLEPHTCQLLRLGFEPHGLLLVVWVAPLITRAEHGVEFVQRQPPLAGADLVKQHRHGEVEIWASN